jgi:hypothetical protein
VNRRDLYKRLLASETRWFGSVRGAPKVYDNVTRNHIDPTPSRSLSQPAGGMLPGDGYYEMIVDVETGDLTFGPVNRS